MTTRVAKGGKFESHLHVFQGLGFTVETAFSATLTLAVLAPLAKFTSGLS